MRTAIGALAGTTLRRIALVWTVFFALVATGIHGSSIGASVPYWNPGEPARLSASSADAHGEDEINGFFEKVGLQPRAIRSDEWLCGTHWALAQCAHRPAFPVVNENIGLGQNMLLINGCPVWHVTALARPSTWGYLLLGQDRGLAWQWWFGPFACFSALMLLFEILLRGQSGLAAFGAFWFCASAYVVCWSLAPAQIGFFPAFGCVLAYWLLTSLRPLAQACCGAALGLTVAGFTMVVYPPWQVAFGWLFLAIFAGLFIRERLYLRAVFTRTRLAAIFLSIAIVVALLGLFFRDCGGALEAMSQTVYPGRRFCTGGDGHWGDYFRGFFNLLSIYRRSNCFLNESEAGGFYIFAPALVAGLFLSRRLRRRLGVVGWLVAAYFCALAIFIHIGIPGWLAKITLLSYCPGYRIGLAAALALIIVSVLLLAKPTAGEKDGGAGFLDRAAPWFGAILMALSLLFYGLRLTGLSRHILEVSLLAALGGGLLSYLLLRGQTRRFCALLTVLLIVTGAPFNPLSVGTRVVTESEMARAIRQVDPRNAGAPLWLCYGGRGGELLYALGRHTLTGVMFHPQLELWRRFDDKGAWRDKYNQYAHVIFNLPPSPLSSPSPASQEVKFETDFDVLGVTVSPLNPVFKRLGARYVLCTGEGVSKLADYGLRLRHLSLEKTFAIYEFP